MTTKEIIVNCIGVIALIIIIRYPGYFKIWGLGSGGRRPDAKDSKNAFFMRLSASITLVAVLFLGVVLLFRRLGIVELDLLIHQVTGFLEGGKVVPNSKIIDMIVGISTVNFFWLIWYAFKDKEHQFSLLTRVILFFSAIGFLFTIAVIQRSYMMYWICIVLNVLCFVRIYFEWFKKQVLPWYRNIRGGKNEKAEKDKESVKDKKDSL